MLGLLLQECFPLQHCFSVLLRAALIWSKEQTQLIWFSFILVNWAVPIWSWEGGRRPLVGLASPWLPSGTWPLCFGFFNIQLQTLDAHFHWLPKQLHLGDSHPLWLWRLSLSYFFLNPLHQGRPRSFLCTCSAASLERKGTGKGLVKTESKKHWVT